MATTRRKKFVVALTATSVLAVTGIGVAYWTSEGSGTGTATTGTSATVSMTQTSVVTNLGPGVAAQPLSGTFTASKPAYVGAVTAEVTGTHTGVSTPVSGCSADDFTIVQPTATDAEVTTGSTWGGGSIVFNNTDQDQDACKGVTVDIAYTSN